MLRATDDCVICKLLPEDTSFGNIILPNGSAVIQQTAIVVAVGRGRLVAGIGTVPLEVKVGDRIIFAAGHPRQPVRDVDGEEYNLISAQAIGAIVSHDGTVRDALTDVLRIAAGEIPAPVPVPPAGPLDADSEFAWVVKAPAQASDGWCISTEQTPGARRVLPLRKLMGLYQFPGEDFEFVDAPLIELAGGKAVRVTTDPNEVTDRA